MESVTGTTGAIPATTVNNFISYLKSSLKTRTNLYEVTDLPGGSGSSLADLKSQYNGAIISKNGKFYRLNFSTGGST